MVLGLAQQAARTVDGSGRPIQIDPQSVRRVAGEFHSASDATHTMAAKLQSAVNTLNGEWRGESGNSFQGAYRQLSGKFDNWVDLLKRIGDDLDKIATHFEEADRTLHSKLSHDGPAAMAGGGAALGAAGLGAATLGGGFAAEDAAGDDAGDESALDDIDWDNVDWSEDGSDTDSFQIASASMGVATDAGGGRPNPRPAPPPDLRLSHPVSLKQLLDDPTVDLVTDLAVNLTPFVSNLNGAVMLLTGRDLRGQEVNIFTRVVIGTVETFTGPGGALVREGLSVSLQVVKGTVGGAARATADLARMANADLITLNGMKLAPAGAADMRMVGRAGGNGPRFPHGPRGPRNTGGAAGSKETQAEIDAERRADKEAGDRYLGNLKIDADAGAAYEKRLADANTRVIQKIGRMGSPAVQQFIQLARTSKSKYPRQVLSRLRATMPVIRTESSGAKTLSLPNVAALVQEIDGAIAEEPMVEDGIGQILSQILPDMQAEAQALHGFPSPDAGRLAQEFLNDLDKLRKYAK